MVSSLPNILPINIVGVVSGTSASGTPTDVFSRAVIQNVVVVNEDPLSVNIVGTVIAVTGTFSESLTISGLPVATSDDVTALQIAISGVEASDVDALTVSGGATIAGTIDFVGAGGTNLSSAGQTITVDTTSLEAQIAAIEASDVDALTVSGGAPAIGTIDFVGADGTNVSRSGQTITITSADVFPSVTASGEANTASNVGIGQGVFFQKVGEDLRFLSFVSTGSITVGLDDGSIELGSTFNSVVEDTTPELGGTLDALGNDIIGAGTVTGTTILAVTGTFSEGLTIGGGSVDITPTGITIEGQPVSTEAGASPIESTPVFIPFPGSGVIGAGNGSEDVTWIYDYDVDIDQATVKTASGTLIYTLKLNDIAVVGLNDQVASVTQAVDVATSAFSYTAGDEITLAISGATNAQGFRFGLKATRT